MVSSRRGWWWNCGFGWSGGCGNGRSFERISFWRGGDGSDNCGQGFGKSDGRNWGGGQGVRNVFEFVRKQISNKSFQGLEKT